MQCEQLWVRLAKIICGFYLLLLTSNAQCLCLMYVLFVSKEIIGVCEFPWALWREGPLALVFGGE